jgi:hypothetical protein
VKKGRHRRYEEARALKHTSDGLDGMFSDNEEPCPECEALPGQDHKSWCLNASASVSPSKADDAEDLFPR